MCTLWTMHWIPSTPETLQHCQGQQQPTKLRYCVLEFLYLCCEARDKNKPRGKSENEFDQIALPIPPEKGLSPLYL